MLDQYIPKEALIEISLVSVLNVSVFITIALVIMSLLLRKGRLVRKVGPSCVMYLLMGLIVRMFIPIEFKFDFEIPIVDVLSPMFRVFLYEVRIGKLLLIQVYQILFIIWMAGAVISILLKFVSYRKIRRYTSLLPISDTSVIKEKIGNNHFFDLLDNVNVAYSNEVSSPYLVGFFRPLIVLPMIDYTDEQMRYVIGHELMHAKHKDVFWKILSDILCTVFWWNPIFNVLREQLFKMIEIRNDREIIKDLNDYEIVGYLECLLDTAINISGKDVLFSVSFSKNDYEELHLRMGLVSENRNYSKRMQIVLTILVSVIVMFTSFFVVEPVSLPSKEEADGGVPLTEENTFLISTEDGYDVYVYDEYLFTTNDLRPFRGVPIYGTVEEALDD